MSTRATLRKPHDFARVTSRGRRGRSDGVTAWVLHTGGTPRLGLAVKGRTAVARNRAKRRVREAWRVILPSQPSDVVVKADADAVASLNFQQLVEHLKRAVT